MKIVSIHIYSHDGRRRDLSLRPGGLSIVTGRSSTGKSALSDIVEYCMGRSTFNVPEGVIRDRVSWYAVMYQFEGERVLIAKPAPSAGAHSCSVAMLRRGGEIAAPTPSEMKTNSDDDAVVAVLTQLIGIPDNRTDVPLDSTRQSFAATIQHTYYYLFQKQGIVTNKEQLLYRQNEQFQPQAIKDTLPILLGVSSDNRFELEARLRNASRALRLHTKQVEQARLELDTANERATGLLSEAKSTGLLAQTLQPDTSDKVVELLRTVSAWKPTVSVDLDDRRMNKIEAELGDLRKRRRESEKRIESARRFATNSEGFSAEASEQKDRLASIGAFPKSNSDEWRWPFVPQNLGLNTSIAEFLLDELRSLESELNAVVTERPKLAAFLSEQEDEVRSVSEQIRAKEVELASAIAANEAIEQMGARNITAAVVAGRVSFFLENLVPADGLAALESEQKRLQRRVDSLQEQVGAIQGDDRFSSIVNNISALLSGYIKDFGAEFSEHPARFDFTNLSIVFDRVDRLVHMPRTGGGANHLAYHIAALLALHEFAARNNRPIPRFLFIDQPTQVYFPSEKVYKAAGGSVEETEAADADLAAVRKLFQLLLNFTEVRVPGFQVIITEHANLRDDWFQDALVEDPWTKPPALVPEDWPSV